VPTRRVYDIVQGQRTIDSDIAHRLAHYFGMSERYWLDLQARYDGKGEEKLPKAFMRKQSLRYAGYAANVGITDESFNDLKR
jgi:plasmid maintenance system antidote protein VapI